jgi:hypothetical protein
LLAGFAIRFCQQVLKIKLKQNKARQNKTKQNIARFLSKTKQNKTKQSKAKQNKVKQNQLFFDSHGLANASGTLSIPFALA